MEFLTEAIYEEIAVQRTVALSTIKTWRAIIRRKGEAGRGPSSIINFSKFTYMMEIFLI